MVSCVNQSFALVHTKTVPDTFLIDLKTIINITFFQQLHRVISPLKFVVIYVLHIYAVHKKAYRTL